MIGVQANGSQHKTTLFFTLSRIFQTQPQQIVTDFFLFAFAQAQNKHTI